MAHVLVVEDQSIIAEYLKEIVVSLGHNVRSVRSGPDAIRSVEECRPDLILMDVRLSGPMDGIETAIFLRNRFGITVAYVTALIDSETTKRAETAHPIGYIQKPFEESDVRGLVTRALSQSARASA